MNNYLKKSPFITKKKGPQDWVLILKLGYRLGIGIYKIQSFYGPLTSPTPHPPSLRSADIVIFWSASGGRRCAKARWAEKFGLDYLSRQPDLSRFTHFSEDFGQKVLFWLKNSVSWVRGALLHGIYCILYWIKFPNLQLHAKTTHLSWKSQIHAWQKLPWPFLCSPKGCQLLPPCSAFDLRLWFYVFWNIFYTRKK